MNLNSQVMDDLQKENTKIARKIYNMLDHEMFACVLVDGYDYIWKFERSRMYGIPNYVYSYLTRFIFKKYGISFYFFGRHLDYKSYLKTLKKEGV